MQNFWHKIRPRIYKKTFYFGKFSVIKFTGEGIGKFFYKLIWIFIVAVMLISMFLGGLAITQNQNTNQVIIPVN